MLFIGAVLEAVPQGSEANTILVRGGGEGGLREVRDPEVLAASSFILDGSLDLIYQ